MPKIKELTGKIFGRWTVIKYIRQNERHDSVWLCKCQCGTVREVVGGSLRGGVSLSCGCLSIEVSTKKATKHGLKKHPLYTIWKDMRKRCNNPNHAMYRHYGGRGIKVCERWNDFKAFYDDVILTYKTGLTLDRFPNNDGDYEPTNFRWATLYEQSINKRSNLNLTFNGVTKVASVWADELGIKRPTLYDRKRHGWTDEEALLGKKQ